MDSPFFNCFFGGTLLRKIKSSPLPRIAEGAISPPPVPSPVLANIQFACPIFVFFVLTSLNVFISPLTGIV